MITKVRLKNWRSHADSTLEFLPGTNALIGIMGSGKSSIMDAICFALFGTFPNLQTKKLKLDDVIMKKPIEKSSAEVEVDVQLDGTKYVVKRIIEKGRGTTFSEIRANGTILESPNTSRVSETVEKHLKVNYELFSKAIYSEQNALDYFLTIPRGQRMKRIDELLMIDKFEKARMSAVSLVNRIADRRSARQSVIEQTDAGRIEEVLKDLRALFTELVQETNVLREKATKATGDIKMLQGELEGLWRIKEEFEFLKRDEKGIESSIQVVNRNLTQLEQSVKGKSVEEIEKDFSDAKTKVSEIGNELRSKKSEFDAASKAIGERKSNVSGLKKEIELLEKEYGKKLAKKREYEQVHASIAMLGVGLDVEKGLGEKKKELEQLTQDAARIYSRISDLNEFVSHLHSPETKCPICDTNLSEERKKLLIIQRQGQIRQMQETFENIKAKREVVEEEIGKTNEVLEKMKMLLPEIKDIEILRRDVEGLKVRFVEASSDILTAENSLSSVRHEVEKLEEQLKEKEWQNKELELLLNKLRDYEEKKFEYEQLLQEREQVEMKIHEKEEKFSGKDLNAIDALLKAKIAEEREHEVKIVGNERLLKEKQQRIAEQEDKLKELERQKEEVQKLEQMIKNLKIFSQALEQTQLELRQEFIVAVNYTMGQLWSTLYPYHDFSGIRLHVEEDDYILQLQEKRGTWINVEGTASGGERSIAALALRIAFSLVLAPQLRMLILDEPTANLDANAIEVLATTLREHTSDIIDQTFLITHDEKLENAVTGSLYKLEREKEKDGVTKIKLM